ncbi:7-carboxy-7-deazaguanine synthase [Candidatus Termititenax aidoneus]|uniref:7-carboxy-7-deazaguanine synthase n=1 Tax=Termititenax aidoneus TaxID=2218524 RepID=A0A388T956_TERA1|nr:7-carboxy-7-deazaguanine synthase [Candidatus Termititenax aidoneus]
MLQIVSVRTDIQRRGLYAGQRQLLIEFALSNIASSLSGVEGNTGEGQAYEPEELLLAVKDEAKRKGEVICLTGGEPLLQINELLPLLESMPLPLYLETNATLPDRLPEIQPYVSLFGLKYTPDYQKEFLESLALLQKEETFVLLPIAKDTQLAAVESLAKLLSVIRRDLPVVIEPAAAVKNALALQTVALRYLQNVRVVPALRI